MAAPHCQRLPPAARHSDVGVDIDTDINLHDSFTLCSAHVPDGRAREKPPCRRTTQSDRQTAHRTVPAHEKISMERGGRGWEGGKSGREVWWVGEGWGGGERLGR